MATTLPPQWPQVHHLSKFTYQLPAAEPGAVGEDIPTPTKFCSSVNNPHTDVSTDTSNIYVQTHVSKDIMVDP